MSQFAGKEKTRQGAGFCCFIHHINGRWIYPILPALEEFQRYALEVVMAMSTPVCRHTHSNSCSV